MRLNLLLHKPTYAICRLPPGTKWPALSSSFLSITQTVNELSVVVEASQVPAGAEVETGWRTFQVAGKLDFSLTGILAAIAQPLAKAEISIFAISTFDTDYVLVQEKDVERACRELEEAGFGVAKQ